MSNSTLIFYLHMHILFSVPCIPDLTVGNWW